MATATTPADEAAPTSGPLSLGDRLHGWREILETANPPSSGRTIPRLVSVLKVFGQPKPDAPPPGYPERGWPLWFVGYAFIHTRQAGGLLTLGLLLNAVLPVSLPWLA